MAKAHRVSIHLMSVTEGEAGQKLGRGGAAYRGRFFKASTIFLEVGDGRAVAFKLEGCDSEEA